MKFDDFVFKYNISEILVERVYHKRILNQYNRINCLKTYLTRNPINSKENNCLNSYDGFLSDKEKLCEYLIKNNISFIVNMTGWASPNFKLFKFISENEYIIEDGFIHEYTPFEITIIERESLLDII